MRPKIVETAIVESCDPLSNGGRLLLKSLFSRGDEKDQLCVRECNDPFINVRRMRQDVAPYGILERSEIPSCRFGTVTEQANSFGENVVQVKDESLLKGCRNMWGWLRGQAAVIGR